jgi:hypothetical protein
MMAAFLFMQFGMALRRDADVIRKRVPRIPAQRH